MAPMKGVAAAQATDPQIALRVNIGSLSRGCKTPAQSVRRARSPSGGTHTVPADDAAGLALRGPQDITHRHLRAFASLGCLGAFTKAAAALDVSQPALSAAIKHLESVSGVQLVERTTRRVSLTEAGKALLPKAETAVASFDRAVEELGALADGRAGCVRIASVPSFVVRVLPRVLSEFSAEFPAVTVHIREENEAEVNRRVLAGDVDFGFGGDFRTLPELAYTPPVTDQVGLLARADHPLARSRGPLAWRDLGGLRFAAFGPLTTLRRMVSAVPGLPASVAEPAYEVADVITLEALLEAGLAVAASFKLGTYRGRDRKLVFRPLVEPALTRTIALVTPSNRTLAPAAAPLVESTILHLRRRTDSFRAFPGRVAGSLTQD